MKSLTSPDSRPDDDKNTALFVESNLTIPMSSKPGAALVTKRINC